jgi:hypothetical protein
MNSLEYHQKGLMDLVKGRKVEGRDPYLEQVAQSRDLAMMREIAVWWRKLHIASQCRFTAKLLKRLGVFNSLVSQYFQNNASSPYIEELSLDFLSWLGTHADATVRAVSQFEWAFHKVRAGSADRFEVSWDRHPAIFLCSLAGDGELPEPEDGVLYRMRIGGDIPGLFECTRESELNAVGCGGA